MPYAKSYTTHGYVVSRNILPATWLNSAQLAVESVIEQSRQAKPTANEHIVSLGKYALSHPHRNPGIDGNAFIHEPYIMGNLITLDRRFLPILSHRSLWSLAAVLLDVGVEQVIFHYTNLTRKPAEIGPAIAWHRDGENTYFCPENDRFLRLLIPLQGMTESNGGTAVIPGSHRNSHINKTTLDDNTIIHPTLEPGDVLAIHPQLLHGGGTNRSQKERDVLIIQFGVAGATFRHQEMLETGSLHPHHTFMQL